MKLKRSKNKNRLSDDGREEVQKDDHASDMADLLRPALPEMDFSGNAWKVLLVDDEPDVHEITRIALKKFAYDGRHLELTSAYSAEQARQILQKDPDFALAVIDVVMETDEAGLDLVRFIREEMKLFHIRLIIRTGQPGKAPEQFVIQHFDIDDYREKTDLSIQKMVSMLRNGIKAFRDISIIERDRIDLDQKVKERSRDLNETNMKLEATVADLQKALRELKQLKGLLPICSYCKKIRDDKGSWHQLEAYIQAHSEAEFSHSICKECAAKFFPEMNLYDE